MFREAVRLTGPFWVHDTLPRWIVHYPATPQLSEHYQAYEAIEPVPKGRNAWSVNNKRLGSQDGYRTLEAAMAAAA